MKIDLTELQQKLANGEFIGFTLAEGTDKNAADKLSDVKLGASKMAAVKLGLSKAGLAKPTGRV